MDKVDKFLNGRTLTSNEDSNDFIEPKESKQKVILIQGDNELSQLAKEFCISQNYAYEAITEFKDISNNYQYSCLLALSYNDADNLMIGSVGLKVYCISHILTLCNSQRNMRMYSEFNFDQVLLYNEEIQKLFFNIKGFVHNAVKDEV